MNTKDENQEAHDLLISGIREKMRHMLELDSLLAFVVPLVTIDLVGVCLCHSGLCFRTYLTTHRDVRTW